MNTKKKYNSGQALITLIFISVIGVAITTGATMLVYINSQSGLRFERGISAYQVAHSGAENALLRLLRDPSYTGESNLPIGEGFADIQVASSGANYVATVSGRIGNFVRKIQINAHYNPDYELILDSRKEIF